jgi:hypothetical protein
MDVQNHLPTQVFSLLFAHFPATAVKNMLTVSSTYFRITLLIFIVRLFMDGIEQASQ